MTTQELSIDRLVAPVYRDDLVTLYNGDAAALLPLLPPFDVMVTDPPYGIKVAKRGSVGSDPGKNSRRTGWTGCARTTKFKPVEWDDEPPPLWLLQMAISRAKWSIVWGGGHVGGMPRATCWLVWDKRNDGTSFSDGEIAWTNMRRAVRMFRWRWNGALQEDMKRKEKRVHPTQKPVPLMDWCLSFVREAKTVVDPFAGSASTLIAARRRGMRAVGIERDKDYCEIAAARLAEEAARAGLAADRLARHGQLAAGGHRRNRGPLRLCCQADSWRRHASDVACAWTPRTTALSR
jgi:site-specific DNA-methyltransferase (adenine-specific)